jgi:transposase-like protein
MTLKKAKLSNYKIKKIINCFSLDLTATQTSKLLKLNRKTINEYYMTFRCAIALNQHDEFEKFVGMVELDEGYFGARRIRGIHGKLKRGRGTYKQPVFGIFERKGRVYTEIIPNCKKRTLQAVILGKVNRNTIIYSDGWRGYNGLVSVGYDKHYRVNHGENEFAKNKHIHINGIESFWSFTKRRLGKFNGVKKYFYLHLKECEWRWKRNETELQNDLLKVLKKFN